MTLYLLKYNNYFNGIVKQEESLSAYSNYLCKYGVSDRDEFGNSNIIETVNFNPNDGLQTTHTINWNGSEPNYIIVAKDSETIVSRWFVTDATYVREGQYTLTLQRDIIVDHIDEVMNSMAYIRRAEIPASNPLIYNSEGMQFNQIKKGEYKLYDRTKRPWIVGYVSPNAELVNSAIVYQGSSAPLTNYQEILEYSKKPLKVISGTPYIDVRIRGTGTHGWPVKKYYGWKFRIQPGNTATVIESYDNASSTFHADTSDSSVLASSLTSTFRNKAANLKSIIATYRDGVSLNNIYQQYNGQVVRDLTTQKYYKITVTAKGSSSEYVKPRETDAVTNSFYQDIENLINQDPHMSSWQAGKGEYSSATLNLGFTVQTYELSIVEFKYGDASVDFSQSAEKRILHDAPYHMFAIPYTDVNYMLAIQIAIDNQSKILDLQILPYCPVLEYYNNKNGAYGQALPDLTGLKQHRDFEFLTIPGGSMGPEDIYTDILFWCTKSVFTFDIPFTIEIDDIKEANECDLYRLCSPNGNGVFEFNAAKNGGVNYINVDCTYRPIDPYIHLNPDFSNLYGTDFNDFRGLILNGDFSVPALNDSWVQYTINNKNYQNIFNREIQSLELQNKYAERNDIWSAIAGAFGAGASAGGAGLIAGGPVAGLIGAGVGGAMSGIAGAFDVSANRAIRQEQLNLKKDLFSYSLQNIQALPQSVSKTGCLTNNNKLVPYIEYYTCTEEERQVLRDKIKYTGMTVGVVGRIGDYAFTGSGEENAKYIEADLLDIPLQENYSIIMEIAKILQEGIRFA